MGSSEEENIMPTTEPGPGQRSDSIMDKNTPINSDGMQKDLKPGAISIIKQYAIEILGVLIFIIGIILLIVYNKETITTESTSNCKKFVYTNCNSVADETLTCAETLKFEPSCTCYLDVNITQELKGNVTVYYELTSFDQKNQSYSSSRDNDQLSGELSPTPSPKCGDYTYDENKKPIAPCGLVAYTMFTDKFELSAKRKPLPRIFTGLIEKGSTVYRNPPNGSIYANFSEEFKKTFVKPKTWKNNIWELDPTNPENNGFQNEAFIAWMNTELSRKPAWRLNQTSDDLAQGLPTGIYKLRIEYSYPPKLYDGERLVWICGMSYTHQVSRNVGVVIFLVIVTIIGLIIAVCRPIRRHFPHLIEKIRKQ